MKLLTIVSVSPGFTQSFTRTRRGLTLVHTNSLYGNGSVKVSSYLRPFSKHLHRKSGSNQMLRWLIVISITTSDECRSLFFYSSGIGQFAIVRFITTPDLIWFYSTPCFRTIFAGSVFLPMWWAPEADACLVHCAHA